MTDTEKLLDAMYEINMDFSGENATLAASVLRAAAHQIKPNLNRTPWLTDDDGYFNETFENYQALGEVIACEKLLTMATELETLQ